MAKVGPKVALQEVSVNEFNNDKGGEIDIEETKDTALEECMSEVPYRISRPLLITMSIFGLLHLNCDKVKWAPITKIYSTVILFLLWAFVIRWCFLYQGETVGSVLFMKLTIHTWSILCACAITMTYKACRKQNNAVKFLKRWLALLNTNRDPREAFTKSNEVVYKRKMKFLFYPSLLLSWLAFLIASSSIGYLQFTTPYADMALTPLPPDHVVAFPLKVLTYVIYVYMTAAWMFSLGFFYCIGGVICHEFQIFNDDFQKTIKANRDVSNLEHYRLRHQDICILTEVADDILRCYSAVSIVYCLFNGIFVLYSMVWYWEMYDENIVVLLSNVFWLVTCLIYLLVISVGGGYINHLAHASLKTIHNIRFQKVTVESNYQMSTFLSKLTGEPIGLTAMDMFVIDKPTLLTIGGVFLTYFVVLIQFQQPSETSASSPCNCSASVF